MKRKQTYKVSEFMAYTSEDMNVLDRAIGHLKQNKEKYMNLVCILAILLLVNNIMLSEDMLKQTISIGNWVIINVCMIDLIRITIKGKVEEVFELFVRFMVITSTLNFAPHIFQFILQTLSV